MKVHKVIAAALLMALMLVIVTACGAPPVTMADVPLFPGATPLEKGQNQIADAAADGLQQSVSKENVTAEVKLYSLPADTEWDAVTKFYNEKLNGSDWKTSSDIAQDTEFFKAVGWTRGSLNKEQALGIGYGPEIAGNGAFMMVMLMSE